MSTPLIGVTTRTAPVPPSDLPFVMVQTSYTKAILQAGGTPVLIPAELPESNWRALFTRLDGILFTGGSDLATELFNGEPHPAVYGVDPARDALELGLIRLAANNEKPFLGICRGLQAVNVALGGTLYTHIPDQHPGALKHDCGDQYRLLAHPVRVEEGSHLGQILGEPLLQVNSLHHQGIKVLAPGLNAVALAPDGLVEGVELPKHLFGLAVQWHPEWLTDQAAMRNLFKAFVEASGK